jgi:predicted N-acetyltransferase YhbS
MKINIKKAQPSDLEELHSLQKMAFRNEAELFDDYLITPLIQSIESFRDDFKNNFYLKAVTDNKIIGSVRANEKELVCNIGRLFVHPEYQNRGIGKLLMTHIEELFKHCTQYYLFTAKRVWKNVHFYSSSGYQIIREEQVRHNLTFVHFIKNRIPSDLYN